MTPARATLFAIAALPLLLAATPTQDQSDARRSTRPAATDTRQIEQPRVPRSEVPSAADQNAQAVPANLRPCRFSEGRTDDCPP
jgi:hypothetical protein